LKDVDGAFRLFTELGYESVSIAQIVASACGSSSNCSRRTTPASGQRSPPHSLPVVSASRSSRT